MAHDDYSYQVMEVTSSQQSEIGSGDADSIEAAQEAILVTLVDKLRKEKEWWPSDPDGNIREQLLTGASEPEVEYWCACETKSSCCNDGDYIWYFELSNGRKFLATYSYDD